jgi:hypothetical protein
MSFNWCKFLVIIFLICVNKLFAQSNTQVWGEYMLNIPVAKKLNLENAYTYSTVLGGEKWRAFDYNATFEYSISPYVDLMAAGLISYTNQTSSYNTLELRPMLGTRFYLTPKNRIQTRILFRLEQRNLKNLESNEWSHTLRPRLRAEVVIPINQKSYFINKLWYAIADAELMFITNDLEERFANRYRIRLGIGYRLNFTTRFELLLMNQESRNGIDERFTSNDYMIRIRVKQYLHKSKPTRSMGETN